MESSAAFIALYGDRDDVFRQTEAGSDSTIVFKKKKIQNLF